MRYRLRTLMIATFIACILFATHAKWRRDAQQRTAIRNNLQAQAAVILQHEDFEGAKPAKYPRWLENLVGTEYLYPLNAFCLVQNAEPDSIITEAASLPHLYLVKLPACQITDQSLIPLTKLRSLVWLELFSTPITDEGVKTVSSVKSIEILDLRSTKVTDGCVPSIASLPRLRRLLVSGTAISPAGIKEIQEALPNCEVDQSGH
jgi:hypothetical protein